MNNPIRSVQIRMIFRTGFLSILWVFLTDLRISKLQNYQTRKILCLLYAGIHMFHYDAGKSARCGDGLQWSSLGKAAGVPDSRAEDDLRFMLPFEVKVTAWEIRYLRFQDLAHLFLINSDILYNNKQEKSEVDILEHLLNEVWRGDIVYRLIV